MEGWQGTGVRGTSVGLRGVLHCDTRLAYACFACNLRFAVYDLMCAYRGMSLAPARDSHWLILPVQILHTGASNDHESRYAPRSKCFLFLINIHGGWRINVNQSKRAASKKMYQNFNSPGWKSECASHQSSTARKVSNQSLVRSNQPRKMEISPVLTTYSIS